MLSGITIRFQAFSRSRIRCLRIISPRDLLLRSSRASKSRTRTRCSNLSFLDSDRDNGVAGDKINPFATPEDFKALRDRIIKAFRRYDDSVLNAISVRADHFAAFDRHLPRSSIFAFHSPQDARSFFFLPDESSSFFRYPSNIQERTDPISSLGTAGPRSSPPQTEKMIIEQPFDPAPKSQLTRHALPPPGS